jgi:hypothetical protein
MVRRFMRGPRYGFKACKGGRPPPPPVSLFYTARAICTYGIMHVLYILLFMSVIRSIIYNRYKNLANEDVHSLDNGAQNYMYRRKYIIGEER